MTGTRASRAPAELLITLDVDWAPDHVIDAVAGQLAAAGVRATWFITHASPAVERLRERGDLFELGIHPNFMPGSTHGATVDAVLAHCLALVPEARVMRTHGLVSSSRLLDEVLARSEIRIDSSLLLRRHPNLGVVEQPFPHGVLARVPIWWEDDVEQLAVDPLWDVSAPGGGGLRVLNFHPVHVALNGATAAPYAALKAAWPVLADAPAEAFTRHRATGDGPATAFTRALATLQAAAGGRTLGMLVPDTAPAPHPACA
ncbi:MAG: hypothetical protein IT355_05245 [Gemmatimonadaceae bacterium]|nr:hypothetical protein [Gemmatimonadaceae bacterium]